MQHNTKFNKKFLQLSEKAVFISHNDDAWDQLLYNTTTDVWEAEWFKTWDRFQYFIHVYSLLCPCIFHELLFLLCTECEHGHPHTLKTPRLELLWFWQNSLLLYSPNKLYYYIYLSTQHGGVGGFQSVSAAPPVYSQSWSRRKTTWWGNYPNTLERGHGHAQ